LSKYFDKNGDASYTFQPSEMKESKFLKLDCSYLKSTGWAPVWDIDTTAEAIYRWYDAWNNNPRDTVSIRGIMQN
jgi:nucleoside-diphosphate-sugar epimerase